jgi:hypothetical protein
MLKTKARHTALCLTFLKSQWQNGKKETGRDLMNLEKGVRFLIYGSRFAEVHLRIDTFKKHIHLLDLDLPERVSLTNSIEAIQADLDLFQQEEIDSYRWFLYGTDGIISEYKNDHFEYVRFSEELVNEDWVPIMQKRIKKYHSNP